MNIRRPLVELGLGLEVHLASAVPQGPQTTLEQTSIITHEAGLNLSNNLVYAYSYLFDK